MSDGTTEQIIALEEKIGRLTKALVELDAGSEDNKRFQIRHIEWHNASEEQAQVNMEQATRNGTFCFVANYWGDIEHMLLSGGAALVPAVAIQFAVNPIREFF